MCQHPGDLIDSFNYLFSEFTNTNELKMANLQSFWVDPNSVSNSWSEKKKKQKWLHILETTGSLF